MNNSDHAPRSWMVVLAIACGILGSTPAMLGAQAPPVDVGAAALVGSVTEAGTPSALLVSNRGKVSGGPNIVYVVGKVPSRSNGAYCVKVRLTAAFPYASDVSARASNGVYVNLYPPTSTSAANTVTVVVHPSGGDYNDTASYRIYSKAQLSDAEATSLGNWLAYTFSAPCG